MNVATFVSFMKQVYFYVHAVCSHKLQSNAYPFPTDLHSWNFLIQVKSRCVMNIFHCASNFKDNSCMRIGVSLPFLLMEMFCSFCNAVFILMHKMIDTVQKTSDTVRTTCNWSVIAVVTDSSKWPWLPTGITCQHCHAFATDAVILTQTQFHNSDSGFLINERNSGLIAYSV